MGESLFRATLVLSPVGSFCPGIRSAHRPGVTPNLFHFRSCLLKKMESFYMDHSHDAFGCMAEILGENFNFKKGPTEKTRKNAVHMWRVMKGLDRLNYKCCPFSHFTRRLNKYSSLLWDVVPSIPAELLGSLLHEELAHQRDRMLFSETTTGGALDFIPSSQSGYGFLLYPGNMGLSQFNLHRVALQHDREGPSVFSCSSSGSFKFQLKGPIRQISSASLLNTSCVAVRLDHLYGVWQINEGIEPRLMQVIDTQDVATCVSVSPHVLGEVLVASESGCVNLWTVGRGIQKVHGEEANIHFNANSLWRWCDFSAHPRVMLYADRTGVELSDIRTSTVSNSTLFSISKISECRRGERLLLTRYLRDAHTFHHLILTQFSAYIMDERLPSVPMLKWDHMMESPPLFCHILPNSNSSGLTAGVAPTTKIVLGSSTSQEICLLQYSGGRTEACVSRGPTQALLRPKDSLKLLPVQIPHRLDIATNRLSSPAAGLTCVQKRAGEEDGADECICVLQLTEAGDVFYQILEPQGPNTQSQPPAAELEPLPRPTEPAPTVLNSETLIGNTSSEEDVIGPTQDFTGPGFVDESPERFSDSEDSENGRKTRKLKLLKLQVLVNEDPESDRESESDVGEKKKVPQERSTMEKMFCNPSPSISPWEKKTPVKLSENARITWKHWHQKLMRKTRGKKPRQRNSNFATVDIKELLQLPNHDEARPLTEEEEQVQRLRRDMRTCMSQRSLLLQSTASSLIPEPEIVPVPGAVNTDEWQDPLSQRLTASWQGGEEAWKAWWDNYLGVNREEKIKALKRKRKKEKEARRVADGGLCLSSSFTSSVTYQSDLDDFSDGTWWSGASQGAWSDSEGVASSSVADCSLSERTTGAPTVTSDSPCPSSSIMPANRKHSNQQRTPVKDATLPKNNSRIPTAEGDLGAANTTQHKLSHFNILEDQEYVTPTPPSVPLRNMPMDLSDWSGSRSQSQSLSQNPLDPPELLSSQSLFQSQDSLEGLGLTQSSQFLFPCLSSQGSIQLSQSLSQSQSSQGRPGLSQSSQAKKKKFRMGF
ncbi:TATA box-binding protein-associated factor RNA polymerase I subunit C isoform X4 [Cynoglossus semilaevis]|uniref:TATA box-binding protein-associated factor RNA polymerase I subunit C isoform X4 n=1 Tax=Cynoglossus semilaevis TaxID=244447 RepID=UPI000D62E055|nr:TATA box-binding protein-associated factor RNA polymerase I subunit C isoform X4 [Cynoglossus semilaevis]